MAKDSIRVGLLGFGTVGSGTFRMLSDNRSSIKAKVGSAVEVVRIGVRDLEKSRIAPAHLMTTDLDSIVCGSEVDVVIEVMGGVEPARQLIMKALESGKHVITANKELIARHGSALLRLASERGLDLHFEAAVGGGIPLIQPLKHQLSGNEVQKLMGIVNGTTNFILTKMWEEKKTLGEALEIAQELGYAEADPSSDIDAFDAQFKTAILASVAFSKEITPGNVYREGIGNIGATDIRMAQILGYRIKLIAIVEDLGRGIMARVHPTLLPRRHPLANVHDVYNAVMIQGNFVGDVILSGRGAGSDPTASAVVGDLIDVGRNIRLGGSANLTVPESGAVVLPIDELRTRYYLRLRVADRPKVLGEVALRLGDHEVGLSAMEMRVVDADQMIGEIVFLTHECAESSIRLAISELEECEMVYSVENVIRVELG